MDKHTSLLRPAVSDKENIYWQILHHIYIIFVKNRWPVKLGIQSGSWSVWIPNFMGNMFYQVLDNLDFFARDKHTSLLCPIVGDKRKHLFPNIKPYLCNSW